MTGRSVSCMIFRQKVQQLISLIYVPLLQSLKSGEKRGSTIHKFKDLNIYLLALLTVMLEEIVNLSKLKKGIKLCKFACQMY